MSDLSDLHGLIFVTGKAFKTGILLQVLPGSGAEEGGFEQRRQSQKDAPEKGQY